MSPFLSLYTPTYRRPQGLARCLASVQAQTAVADIEQIVIPDHVGVGVGGMFERVPHYASAVHGRYVAFLCDDDVLAAPDVVAQVKACAEAHGEPELLLVWTQKGDAIWPTGLPWPPQMGAIDLNCAIVRRDIWQAHVTAYGSTYEGDYHFLAALYAAGVKATWCPVMFSVGAVSRGAAEAA